MREQVQEIFTHLGYQVLEGPEIEDDYHNFEALNMAADHPARDMHDTLYLAEPMQPTPRDVEGEASARQRPEPSATASDIAPHTHVGDADPAHGAARSSGEDGRDWPRLSTRQSGLTHTPMFHQVEGLVVGPNITLADLKGTLAVDGYGPVR